MGGRTVWDGPGVCVWLCRLDDDRDISLDRARLVLDASERDRAARFHFERDRSRFMRARGFLREKLAGYMGVTPDQIVIEQMAHGKPVLPGGVVHFNLSHSQHIAVVAISTAHHVGIDVEVRTGKIDPLALAPDCFIAHELHALRDLPHQMQRFYAFWTAKEAFMKLTGQGMSLDPRLIILCLDKGGWPVGYDMGSRGAVSLRYIDLHIAHTTCCLAMPDVENTCAR